MNYEIYWQISNLYYFQYALHAKKISILSLSEACHILDKGLKATNQAMIKIDGFKGLMKPLSIICKPAAVFRKFLFLQNIKEISTTPPYESAIEWLRIYLKSHQDSSSKEYFEYAQIYGGELAKEQRFEEAHRWFLELNKINPHPITYLNLGKMFAVLRDSIQAVKIEEALKLDPTNLEIKLWLAIQTAEAKINELRSCPSFEKRNEVTEIIKQLFCAFDNIKENTDVPTSTGFPIQVVAIHLYAEYVPDIAHQLALLQDFNSSLFLYHRILDSFATYVKFGALKPSVELKLHSVVGALHFFLKHFDRAEEHLNRALELNEIYLPVYINLQPYMQIKKGKPS